MHRGTVDISGFPDNCIILNPYHEGRTVGCSSFAFLSKYSLVDSWFYTVTSTKDNVTTNFLRPEGALIQARIHSEISLLISFFGLVLCPAISFRYQDCTSTGVSYVKTPLEVLDFPEKLMPSGGPISRSDSRACLQKENMSSFGLTIVQG